MPHWTVGKSAVTAAARQVGGTVPVDVQGLRALVGDDRTRAGLAQAVGQVHGTVVDHSRQRGLGEPGEMAFGDVAHGCPAVERTRRPVRKSDGYLVHEKRRAMSTEAR
jgi:hypothetical protein